MRTVITLALIGALAGCTSTVEPTADNPDQVTEQERAVVANESNVLLAEWTGPYGGVPPLDKVEIAHFQPAIEQAMADYLAEIDAIANNTEPATFENTIVAMERTGKSLDRVMTVYGIWNSTMSGPEMQAIQAEMAPKLASLSDKVYQNAKLFERIETVWNSEEKAGLNAEQQRLVWLNHKNFVRSGAKLGGEQKERLAAINQELASLYTSFGQNLLKDEETWVVIDSEEQLKGMSADYIRSAAAAATERGLEGKWAVVNTRSFVDPFLTYAEDRGLREQVWKAFVNRGDNGGETDNNENISKILALRAERAKLLGHETHAHWRLEDAMAGTPENAIALMESVWPAAVARVEQEVGDQQKVADAEGAGITIEPWDYRFYQEKVRKQRYDLDATEVSQYMQLEKLREAMFWAAGEIYGLQFAQVSDVPVHHEDVRVWEVKDASGKHVGLWYFDPFARSGKRSGAWMNAYRSQSRFDGEVTTIVSNNSNFVKGAPGEAVLISWDDASTLFHEFGHALHGLLSNVTYPSLAGTAVARDYVEFPSQINEHWLATPEVLSKFALHVETGEPIPDTLVKRIEEAGTFGEGFATVEYLASALVDMKLHLAGDRPIDPDAFEKETLGELGMPEQIVMRHRTPQFAHVFSGDGYSAGYYSYLWSDTLTADAAEAFMEAPGGMYDKDVAKSFVDNILSVGNTVDPAEGFKAFRGREVSTSALMRKRGFPVK